jgi:phage tail-like protein
MEVAQQKDPVLKYLFVVSIPGVDTIGYFTKCDGLELFFDVLEYQEGGNTEFIHQLPGQLHSPRLTLSRGLTNEDALLKWFWTTMTQAEKKEITLTLSGGPVQRVWTFVDAFPVKWTGPTIDSETGDIATESLEIAHAGLKMA